LLDLYQILGVDKNASAEALKKAYRLKAKSFHPDVNQSEDADEKFQEVLQSYMILSDPEKRMIYDRGFELPRHKSPTRDKHPPPHAFKRQSFFSRPRRYGSLLNHGHVEYSEHTKSAKIIGIITLLFALTFLIDHLFHEEYVDLKVTHLQSKALLTRKADDVKTVIVTAGNHQFEKRQEINNKLKVEDLITIRKSVIYNYVSFKLAGSSGFKSARKISGIINTWAILIFIASLTTIFSKKRPEVSFNAALIAAFLSVAMFAFLLIT